MGKAIRRRVFAVSIVMVLGVASATFAFAVTTAAHPRAAGASPIATTAFPAAGTDTFDSFATVEVQAPPGTGPITTLHLDGVTRIHRSGPGVNANGHRFIDTHMLSLDLTGTDPTLGQIKVHLNNRYGISTGMVTANGPSTGPDFPAESCFDVFFDITSSGTRTFPPLDLHNRHPAVMCAPDITTLPPIGSVYAGHNDIPLLNHTGTEVALMISAQHVPTIDHFLCYSATSTAFSSPPSPQLENQFNMGGFSVTPVAVTEHCNPVQKKLPNRRVTPISNPVAHLLCWSITTSMIQPTFTVDEFNQFGSAQLNSTTVPPGQPTSLCLPTWKSLTGPPDQSPSQPPGLDHFTCYPVSYVRATPPFPDIPKFVTLTDQFGEHFATVGAPTQLCVPTQKTIGSHVTPITDPTDNLLCFAVTLRRHGLHRTVFDQNQFGTGLVKVTNAETLCLPSENQ